ncbi:MAG: 5-oxoprolinase subunit PxpB, partial [Bacteroidota bacterium]
YGDRGLLIQFEDHISKEISSQVKGYLSALRELKHPAIQATIPAFASISLMVDVNHTTLEELKCVLDGLMSQPLVSKAAREIRIPVCYGGEFGPDLIALANYQGMSVSQFIELHHSTSYQVYMRGFIPGFAYLGDVPSSKPTPRLKNARLRVPKGSIALAGFQTAIYPSSIAGGWQIIGHTPLGMVKEGEHPPFLIDLDDLIRFIPISLSEHEELSRKRKAGQLNWEDYYG